MDGATVRTIAVGGVLVLPDGTRVRVLQTRGNRVRLQIEANSEKSSESVEIVIDETKTGR